MSDRFSIGADGMQMRDGMLGRGGFALVKKAVLTSTKTEVAVKIFRPDSDSQWENLYAGVKKEDDLMRMMRHPNIIEYIGYLYSPGREYRIIMELMKGTLGPFGLGQEVVSDFCKFDIAVQCFSALVYLHDRANIWHKDIKPDNILFKKLPGGKILTKLSDFGLSAVKAIKTSEPSHGSGTVDYMAPEVYAGGIRSEKSDVFSMGVTLTEFFTGKRFWPKQPMVELQLARAYEQATAPDSEKISAIDVAGHYDLAVLSTCLARVIPCLKDATTIQTKLRPTAVEALETLIATDSGNWRMKISNSEVTLFKYGGEIDHAVEQRFNLWRSTQPESPFCKFIAVKCGIGETEIMQADTLFSLLQEYVFPYVVNLNCYHELPAEMSFINLCILKDLFIYSKTASISVGVLPSTLKYLHIDYRGDLQEDVLSVVARWCPNLHSISARGNIVVKSEDVFKNFCASCPALKNIRLDIFGNGGWLSECDSFWKLPLVELDLILHENEPTEESILPMIAKNFKSLKYLTFKRDGTLSDNEVSPLSELTNLKLLVLNSEKLIALSAGIATIVKAGNVNALTLYNIFVGNESFAGCPKFFTTVKYFETSYDELPAEKAVEIVNLLRNFGILKKVEVRVGGTTFWNKDFQEDFATIVCKIYEIYTAAGQTSKVRFGITHREYLNR